jgi:hypothetical protein
VKKQISPKVYENYMLFRDDEGWKIMHPLHGAILLTTEVADGPTILRKLEIEQAVLYSTNDGFTEVLTDCESVDQALEIFEDDGYSKGDITKMNPREEMVALFV